MKCKAKKSVEKYETMTKQGKRLVKMAVAICPDCGSKMVKMVSNDKQ
jgi:rRNA maturation endonuclease Nob1